MWGFVISRISLYRGSFCRGSLNGGLRYIKVRYTEDFVIPRENEVPHSLLVIWRFVIPRTPLYRGSSVLSAVSKWRLLK